MSVFFIYSAAAVPNPFPFAPHQRITDVTKTNLTIHLSVTSVL